MERGAVTRSNIRIFQAVSFQYERFLPREAAADRRPALRLRHATCAIRSDNCATVPLLAQLGDLQAGG